MRLGRIKGLVLCCWLITGLTPGIWANAVFSSIAVDPNCSANLIQNGDFEQSTPTAADNDILEANFWGPIWQPTNGFSTGDFFSTSISIPTLEIPTPLEQNNYGGMWCALASNQIFREGIMNELSSTILPNTGSYELTFKVACLSGYWGTPSLSAWGVNAAGLATGASPTSFSMPRNDGFYGIDNSFEIAAYTFDADCDEAFVDVRFTLNTASPGFPAAGINHIFFTRRDNLSGGVYIALDDVCLQSLIPLEIAQFDCTTNTGTLQANIEQVDQDILEYTWILDGVFTASTSVPTLSIDQIGTYTVEVTLADGCSLNSEQVEVVLTDNALLIEQLITTNATCEQANGSLLIEISGESGTITFSINGSTGQVENEFLNLAAGVYEIIIEDENGCTATQSAEILNVGIAPQIVEAITTDASCSGMDGTITISAEGGTGSLQYSIDNGANFQSSASFSDLNPGEFMLLVLDENDCSATQSITVNSSDQAPDWQNIAVASASCKQLNGEISVQASGGTGTLTYALEGGVYQTTGLFMGLGTGSYLLSVQDELGCTRDSLISVPASACPIYVPNAFSPNQDGVNDRFQVFSADATAVTINHYAIFDRWGALLYEARNFSLTDVTQFWNGTFQGQVLGPGTYVYMMDVNPGDGQNLLLSGDLLLIR
ncbi:MAG: gliding motility-associated C-terminal domain-containing protein [Bacteroidota bacterium]